MPIDINYEIVQPHQKVIGLKDPNAFSNAQQPEQHLSLPPCTQLWLSQNSAILAPRP